MKKFYSITCILLLSALILIGYLQKDFTYTHISFISENKQWKAVFREVEISRFIYKDGTLSYKSSARSILAVAYKGNLSDLSSFKHLEIGYKAGMSGGSLTSDFTDYYHRANRIISLQTGGSSSFLHPNDLVKVTINLDGKLQTLELKFQKNERFYLSPPRLNIYL